MSLGFGGLNQGIYSRDFQQELGQAPIAYRQVGFPITPNNNRAMSSTQTTRRGILANAGSWLVGLSIRRMACLLRKSTGAPTGNITFTFRNAADAVKATVATFDSATELVATYRWKYAPDFGPIPIVAGDKILVEYSAGDASNNIVNGREAAGPGYGDGGLTQDSDFTGSYTNLNTVRTCMQLWT